MGEGAQSLNAENAEGQSKTIDFVWLRVLRILRASALNAPGSGCFAVKTPSIQMPPCNGSHCISNRRNVLWRGAAAASHDIDQAFGRKFM